MKSFAQILKEKSVTPDRRNKYEFQAYGNRLAEEFNDTKHRSLFIKLAKNTPRILLEKAREYVLNSETADTKGKLFMWKLGQLRAPFGARAVEQLKKHANARSKKVVRKTSN